jgi:hypothetical protein
MHQRSLGAQELFSSAIGYGQMGISVAYVSADADGRCQDTGRVFQSRR